MDRAHLGARTRATFQRLVAVSVPSSGASGRAQGSLCSSNLWLGTAGRGSMDLWPEGWRRNTRVSRTRLVFVGRGRASGRGALGLPATAASAVPIVSGAGGLARCGYAVGTRPDLECPNAAVRSGSPEGAFPEGDWVWTRIESGRNVTAIQRVI